MPSPNARLRRHALRTTLVTIGARVAFAATLSAPLGLAVNASAANASAATTDAGASVAAAANVRRALPVARVGDSAVVVSDVEDRVASIPFFQLASFGLDADAIRHRVLSDVLVPDALFVAGARADKLDARPDVAHPLRRALSSATLRATRAALPRASEIAMDDVRAYYEAHRARYEQPERINVFRILCATRDEATKVLEAAKKDGTPQAFLALAREHSLDKATNLRSGNLGFVAPDGVSSEAGIKVDVALVKAAATVRDGELVPAPVAEGNAFAVVLRRGTLAAAKKSVDDASAQIRDSLFRQRLELAHKALLDDLRAKKVSGFDASPLDGLELPEVPVVATPKPATSSPPPGGAR